MDYIKAASACTRDEDPVCATVCPFHLDIRTLISRIRNGRFESAYRLLRDAMVFPETALRLCQAPCAAVCERCVCDEAVDLHGLERAAARYTIKKDALRLNVPPKAQRIAVVGGGISGLACAVRFSARGYRVVLYEQTDRLGGRLWARFPDGAFLEEITRQLENAQCECKLSSGIRDLKETSADAVYVATGRGGDDFGRLARGGADYAADGYGVFFGGGLVDLEGVNALAQGIGVVNRVESFLKTGVIPERDDGIRRAPTRPNPASLSFLPPEPPSGSDYTGEEAAREAARCLQCNCDSCAERCPLVKHYRRFPDRIAEETEGTVHPVDLINNRLATRLVASCDQCGLCAEDCPEGVDLREILANAKREMKANGDMPGHFSAFWLEDMEHAGRTAFQIKPEGSRKTQTMFFPGCRLGADDPRYVTEAYRRLLQNDPDMVILTDCCGAPAYWAGDMERFAQKAATIRKQWEDLGEPVPVCACPTCAAMLKEILPGCKPVSLYTLDMRVSGEIPTGMGAAKTDTSGDRADVPTGAVPADAPLVCVFDPCASRSDHRVQEGVRGLLEDAGFVLQPLAFERENTLCCGWGGQYMIANSRMSGEAAARNASLAEYPYVTYCVNCRDTLVGAGKPAWHILDILFGLNSPDRKPPTHSRRRENREALYRGMTGGSPEAAESRIPGDGTRIDRPALFIDETLREKISGDWILEEDALQAILHCEGQNRKVRNEAAGSFVGYYRQNLQTYWVEYIPESAGYRLLNAYAHRLTIDET